MYLLDPNRMLDNDYRLPSYIEASSTPIIPGVDIATLPEALRELLTKQRDVPEFTEEEAMNGNGGYPSKFTAGDDGWIETPEATGPPSDGVYPVLSIDCEMVSHSTSAQGMHIILMIDRHADWTGIGSYIHYRFQNRSKYIRSPCTTHLRSTRLPYPMVRYDRRPTCRCRAHSTDNPKSPF
jgi:hypothetical protein